MKKVNKIEMAILKHKFMFTNKEEKQLKLNI